MSQDDKPTASRSEATPSGRSLRGRMRRSPDKRPQPPLRNLLPNVLTVLALCAGLTAIRFGLEGRYEFAVYAILVAALLDAFDGRLARMLKAQSSFGAELDSLADFFNFGVAPVLILYTWSLDTLGGLGWWPSLVTPSPAPCGWHDLTSRPKTRTGPPGRRRFLWAYPRQRQPDW